MNNGSTLVGTVTDRLSTSFLDAFGFHGNEDTLRPNTDYYYRVYVYDRGGLSAGGNVQLVTPENGRGTWGTGLPAWQPLPKR